MAMTVPKVRKTSLSLSISIIKEMRLVFEKMMITPFATQIAERDFNLAEYFI